MNQDQPTNLHYFIRAFILFGIAMYIVYLVKSDSIVYYIAPRMVIYIKLAAIGLYAVAVYQGYLAIKSLWNNIDDCDCGNAHSSSKFKNTVLYSLFIVPLLLGFMLPDSAMGSALVSKKGLNLSSSSTLRSSSTIKKTGTTNLTGTTNTTGTTNSGETNSTVPADNKATPLPQDAKTELDQTKPASNIDSKKLDEMFKSDQFTELYAKQGKQLYMADLIQVKEDIYIETLTTLDLYLDNFIGKKLEISGFVYRDDKMPDNQVVIARFAIQCCSADAAPYGVLVEFPHAKNYSSDTWVNVTGIVEKSKEDDLDIVKLKVTNIEKIDAPASPYVYPNYDFNP